MDCRPHIGGAARRCWVSSAGAPGETQAPKPTTNKQLISSGDSLAAETADPGPPPTPPQRTSSHAGRNPPPARTAAASLERRWRGRRQTASPATKMGAGMSQIFEDSPLKINAVAKWTNPAGCDLVFVGANEGLYYMSLDQLHDPHHGAAGAPALPWLFVYRGILVSLSGRHASALQARSGHSYFLPMPSLSSRAGLPCGWPTTRRQRRSPHQRLYAGVAAKHPRDRRALAGLRPAAVRAAAPQWDNARRTFPRIQIAALPDLPQPLLTSSCSFEAASTALRLCRRPARPESDACVPVSPAGPQQAGRQIELSPNDETALDEEVEVTSVTQLDLNHVLVCYATWRGCSTWTPGWSAAHRQSARHPVVRVHHRERGSALTDSLLCFYKHGASRPKSFLRREVVQDGRGPRRPRLRFVGFAGQNPVMERRPADDPMAAATSCSCSGTLLNRDLRHRLVAAPREPPRLIPGSALDFSAAVSALNRGLSWHLRTALGPALGLGRGVAGAEGHQHHEAYAGQAEEHDHEDEVLRAAVVLVAVALRAGGVDRRCGRCRYFVKQRPYGYKAASVFIPEDQRGRRTSGQPPRMLAFHADSEQLCTHLANCV
uniref:BTB domain-containing protein n=1 Tax=Macrostomum lignano TaxID=282301 RepID=A0A1I8FJ90_9PLAT